MAEQTGEPSSGVCFFRVDGIPIPQGSMKAFVNRRTGRPIVTSDNKKTRPWREAIIAEVKTMDLPMLTGPIELGATFYFPRPQGHYGRRGNILPSAPLEHITKPDLDKLLRSLGDALKSAGVYKDDSHVVAFLLPQKRYCDMPDDARVFRPGADVMIRWRADRQPGYNPWMPGDLGTPIPPPLSDDKP